MNNHKRSNRILKQAVKAILSRLGYRIVGTRHTPRQLLEPELLRFVEFDDVVCRQMFEYGEDCVFIQVGAYDGVSIDPLRKYIERCDWQGVMLEPQPGPAAKLRERYRGRPDIVVMQAALDGQRGRRRMYTVESNRAPSWAGAMASFDRDHLLKHDYIIPDINSMIRELTVECVVFDDVLEKLPAGRLDLLQIDAEGADGYVLSLFPFAHIKPAIVQWESKNLVRAQQELAIDRLIEHGYLVAQADGENMLAVQSAYN